MAATKVNEWTLAKTVTKGKKEEENMMVVRKLSDTHKFSFQPHVFVCSRTDPYPFLYLLAIF